MTENKSIEDRISEARRISADDGNWEGAIKLMAELFIDHKGATHEQIIEISAFTRFLLEKIATETLEKEQKEKDGDGRTEAEKEELEKAHEEAEPPSSCIQRSD